MNKLKYLNKVLVIDDEYTLKEEKDLTDIYEYFKSRGFTNFNPLIERVNNKNKYRYLKDNTISLEQKSEDIAKSTALLHSKTSHFKSVNIDKYTEIYDNLIGYINYLEDYYLNYLKKIEYVEYPSPSETLFLSNYYKLNEVFIFLKKETKAWYDMVRDNTKARVVYTHGDLSLDHIIGDKLISFNSSKIDTPIVDIVNYVHNEWESVDLSEFLNIYLKTFNLLDHEKKLLFINLSIPYMITDANDEFLRVKDVRKLYDYLFKIESLIRPYYSV